MSEEEDDQGVSKVPGATFEMDSRYECSVLTVMMVLRSKSSQGRASVCSCTQLTQRNPRAQDHARPSACGWTVRSRSACPDPLPRPAPCSAPPRSPLPPRQNAPSENRTRVPSLEGLDDDHYTNGAQQSIVRGKQTIYHENAASKYFRHVRKLITKMTPSAVWRPKRY